MSEVLEKVDEKPEVVTPEQEAASEPRSEAEAPKPVEPPKEDHQEKNWRAARARMEELHRQNQRLEFELENVKKAQAPQKDPEEEEYLTESEKKLHRKIKDLESKVKQRDVKDADYVVDRLKAKYADFDEVVNQENIEYLQTNNAALAEALASLKDDPYKQGQAAYDALRKTKWYEEKHLMRDKVKLEENSKKPMSVQAVRKQGPLSEANQFDGGRLTPEMKKQFLKEMEDARMRA